MVKFFNINLIILLSLFLIGCNHKSIVSISEQIAIYQNLGFEYEELLDSTLSIGNNTININTTDEINTYLANQNINSSVQNLYCLYLFTDNSLQSLIYIYEFENNQAASNFISHFQEQFNNSIFLHRNYVIQKGITDSLQSGSQNYIYFKNFCKGIKK